MCAHKQIATVIWHRRAMISDRLRELSSRMRSTPSRVRGGTIVTLGPVNGMGGARPDSLRGSLALSEQRTARLLFDVELGQGMLDPQALCAAPAVRAALRVRKLPGAMRRRAEQIAFKAGILDWDRAVQRPLLAARRAVLGDRAATAPRFLVRVDEFPHYRAWCESGAFGTDAYARFHEVMRAAGVPYLLAVLPWVSERPLDPRADRSRELSEGEVAQLRQLADDGVCFGLHGRDHRTRHASSRHHSELCGLDAAATERLLDEGLAQLAAYGVDADVFVPPYNRFDAAQMPLLTRRFAVVCGGPESIGTLGFHRTPQWRGDAVYLPAYPPFYGTAEQILPAACSALERRIGLWLPVVLHWEWEARDQCRSLKALANLIAAQTSNWSEFLASVERSRAEA